ncbi:hypothetical protein 18_00068 [Pseudomonas phage Epa18]|uniref:Dit-like phage tail protein N-terminal domain-containing protein n=6 Tax=Nankokuvirus TaxID=1925779 RepID=A0A6G9LF61_9CAUD|nr:tail fiber protein [Pseudomonas phage CHA_P1]QEM40944.1 hypothetical protein PAPJP_018 [Pseudomonas phage PAP-JP]QIQ63833.1 hypothetical protein Epa24_00065 [Pseudomonas phage Epa24]QIQ64087.1 hypothetical protein Epa17_00092 [Pseudomonas phage Epa17]QIQ64979.1 hypothetical protein 16_00011 [Pseudomonas phage Epa16]QIQ65139.1 hypothetical protein 18_00068 [Pseudomonas phage Epa18]QIQ65614.1 hypothetical protein 26_00106 [Pseudomonas phage Epa26]WAB57397.1 hypothetical protein [Pseudomonas
MTVAIQRESGDIIWFDAILNLNISRANQVTQHVVESGASVTDHVIAQNQKMTLSGVVSDADFNLDRPVITAADAQAFGITPKPFVNSTPVTSGPIITPGADTAWTNFLPETVNQFLDLDRPTVVVPAAPKEKGANLIREELDRITRDRERIVLLDFEGSAVRTIFQNVVITSISFKEDPQSGESLYVDLAFEVIRTTTFQTAAIPKKVSDSIKNKASEKQAKGKQAPKDEKVTDADGKNPKGETVLHRMTNREVR